MDIKKLRKHANLTQEQLAQELSLKRSTIAKWETGVTSPRFRTLPALAKALDVTYDELLKDKRK